MPYGHTTLESNMALDSSTVIEQTGRSKGFRLHEFDPTLYDWEEWEVLFDTFLAVEGIVDSEKKRNLLITALGVQPFKILMSVCKPKKPTEFSYEELILKLHTNYARVTFPSTERVKFFATKQSTTQSLTDFANDLRNKTTTCEFPNVFYEEALITAFVGGLSNDTVRKHLMQQDLKNFEETLNIAKTIDSIRVQGSTEKSVTSEENDINKIDKRPGNVPDGKNKFNCSSCGSMDHPRSQCRFRNAVCYKCKKEGHITKVCRSKQSSNQLHVNTISSINYSSNTSEHIIKILLQMDNIDVQLELDTGSPITIISKRTWQELGRPTLQVLASEYNSFSGHSIQFEGERRVNVNYNGQCFKLNVVVGTSTCKNILGRDWIMALKLNRKTLDELNSNETIASINESMNQLNELMNQYNDIFQDGLGCCKVKAHLYVKPNVTPKFCKARSLPFAYREAVELDLARLVTEGVLEPVNVTKWAAPIVVVPKPGGKIRICADFSTGVNPALDIEQYPLPKPNELFITLNGGKLFSKLDFSEAYLQVELDDESKQLLVINTHKGLFRFNRLPFGIASAPGIFQKLMDQILSGLDGVVCYLDDIIITGKTESDHLSTLKQVFDRIQQYGFHINKTKCQFLQEKIEYLGFIVDQHGIHTSPSKIQAIINMPKPTNLSQLRSFLGMVNHYAKFIPKLSDRLYTLYALLKKNVSWQWSGECQETFKYIKDCLASPLALTHYNPNLPLILAADASSIGVGAVLYHRFPDGSEKVIGHASKTLTETERRYAQIEKEALAIIYGIQKFDQFVRGRHFTLITDHKPLTTIFGSKKGLPTTSANRLQRWAIRLMGYHYTIEYCHTSKFGRADGLSRLPSGPDRIFDKADPGEINHVSIIQKENEDQLPLHASDIARETRRDPVLALVYHYTLEGWPIKHSDECHSYYKIREELSTSYGCLTWGLRTIIPKCFRNRLLQHLHVTHAGMGRMKGEARRYFWWPLLDKEIEEVARNCATCTENSKQIVTVPVQQWPIPDQPWQRIHIDFMGKFMGSTFLVLVDAHSKWLEVIVMKEITTTSTIKVLSSLFARYGLCSTIVSDNGTQFTSDEFNKFCIYHGIIHLRTTPAHAQSNGQAERYVDIVKSALTKGLYHGGNLSDTLEKFLFSYRTTPHSTTGYTPAELFLKRSFRTVLDLIRPNITETTHKAHKRYELNSNRHTKERIFFEGNKVLVRDFRNGPNKIHWTPGVLMERQGCRIWKVKIQNMIWRRHENQIKHRHWEDEEEMITTKTTAEMDQSTTTTTSTADQSTSTFTPAITPTSSSTPISTTSTSSLESPILRRSTRLRKPVRRLIDEI